MAFILVDVRSSKAAAVLLFTLIGGFQNLLKHNRFSISKAVVAFRFPRVHALRFFAEWAPQSTPCHRSILVRRTGYSYVPVNRPLVARSPDDEKVLRVGLYLMSRVSDSKGQFEQCLHVVDPRTTCLARMPTMCVLSIHLATSIISQILVNYGPQLLFPNPIMGVQCSLHSPQSSPRKVPHTRPSMAFNLSGI